MAIGDFLSKCVAVIKKLLDNEKFTEYIRGDMHKNISAVELYKNIFHTVCSSHVYPRNIKARKELD